MSTRALRRALAVAMFSSVAAMPLAVAPQVAQADSHAFLTVMTRNLDEGTDFGYIMAAAQGLMSFSDAVTATYLEVLGSNVCGRAAQIADEIAAAQPDLVSVQEAAQWTGPLPTGCAAAPSPTTIDAQAALMARLAADGAQYVVVSALDEFSSASIAALLPPGMGFLDRDLLLARVEPAGQLALSNVMAQHFSTLLPLPLGPGLSIPVTRGWISADVTVRGSAARMIATHLESFYQPVQMAQAMELVAGPANTSMPVVLAGDLNTGPGSAQMATYDWLTGGAGGGFVDTWAATHPGDPGYTDAFYTEDPFTPSTPSERIDLVLVRNAAVPSAPKDFMTGLELPHPSDHAGVVAKVTLPS